MKDPSSRLGGREGRAESGQDVIRHMFFTTVDWDRWDQTASYGNNQLEKLEAARDARLVCLSLLSLTGSFLVLLSPSGLFFSDLTRPYLALLGLTSPYFAFV